MTAVARAHGRVNLIGEHTDYNGGWVLPTPIPQWTETKVERSGQGEVFIDAGRARLARYELGREGNARGDWRDYILGCTKLLRADGHSFGGFRAEVRSTMPEGSGLSSSAALEVSLLKALREEFRLSLDDLTLARLGQRVENEFVGARVGIMDQVACAMGLPGTALFLDTQTLQAENIPLPAALELLVIGSGISHRNAGGGYNIRRAECEEACRLLGIPSLRELRPTERLAGLPPVLERRARHVVTENARVHEAVAALRGGKVRELGDLFRASHASMRDDYEVSLPEIDLLVDLLDRQEQVFGARLTGGGFGGSVVALVFPGEARRVAERVIPIYGKETGERAMRLVPQL
jgi:galactokinase